MKVICINELYYILAILYLADFLVDLVVTCFLLIVLLSDLRTNGVGCCCCLFLFVNIFKDLLGFLVSSGVSLTEIKSPVPGPVIAVMLSNSVGDAIV